MQNTSRSNPATHRQEIICSRLAGTERHVGLRFYFISRKRGQGYAGYTIFPERSPNPCFLSPPHTLWLQHKMNMPGNSEASAQTRLEWAGNSDPLLTWVGLLGPQRVSFQKGLSPAIPQGPVFEVAGQ